MQRSSHSGLRGGCRRGIHVMTVYIHVHVIVVSWFYSVWDMYHARLYVLSRVEPKEVHTARGRCYPMHCKNHETADLYR